MTPPACPRCHEPMRLNGIAPSGGQRYRCVPCRKYATVHDGTAPQPARIPFYRESALPAPLPVAAPTPAGKPRVTFLPPASAYGADVPADCWRIARAAVRSGSAE